jgi:hypothetical protein
MLSANRQRAVLQGAKYGHPFHPMFISLDVVADELKAMCSTGVSHLYTNSAPTF